MFWWVGVGGGEKPNKKYRLMRLVAELKPDGESEFWLDSVGKGWDPDL